jgi:hypothetical protein
MRGDNDSKIAGSTGNRAIFRCGKQADALRASVYQQVAKGSLRINATAENARILEERSPIKTKVF